RSERDPDGVRRAAILLVLVHPLLVGGQAQVAGHVKGDVLAGFFLQSLVETDRVFVDLPYAVAHVEKREQASGMPGGASGQFCTFQQNDVGPAELGKVVEGGNTDGAAADHDNAGMALHCIYSVTGQFSPAAIPRGW